MNKDKIIKRSEEYTKIINNNQSKKNKFYSIYYIKSDIQKYGITVPKKIGNAVIRNKIKRQVKNIISMNEINIQTNYNYVIIIKEAAKKLSYEGLTNELMNLLKKVR